MLHKLAQDHPRKWHQVLAPLMFAIQEVPQASFRFSPFELLYGRQPRKVLDLVREQWEAGLDPTQNANQHVLEMCEHLWIASELMQRHLQEAQASQRDAQIQPREFAPGQKVLLLLPSKMTKLCSQWQGPYEVIRRLRPVDYEIRIADRRRPNQLFHVNVLFLYILKEWQDRGAFFGMVNDPELGPEAKSVSSHPEERWALAEHWNPRNSSSWWPLSRNSQERMLP